MGDIRYRRHLERLVAAKDRLAELKSFDTTDLVRALAAASQEREPYLANIIATELEGRLSRSTLVLNSAPRGLVRISPAGRITDANNAAERMLGEHIHTAGAHREGLLRWTDAPWFAHDDAARERAARAFAQAAAGRIGRVEAELRSETWEGRVEITLTPIKRAGGEIRSIIAELQETSDLPGAEDLRRRRDIVAQQVEPSANSGSWEYDVELDRVSGSAGLLTLLGLGKDAPTRLDDAVAVIHTDDRDVVEAAMSRAITEGTPFDITVRIDHGRTGEPRMIRSTALATRTSDGRVDRIFGAVQDVTEDRARENALQSAKLHERVGEFGTWELDLLTDVTSVSEGISRIFGLQPADRAAPEDAIWRHVHEEDIVRLSTIVERAKRTGEAFEVEYRIHAPGGGVRWLRSMGECQTDSQNTPKKLVGVVQDITHVRDVEEKLHANQKAMKDLLDALMTFAAQLSPRGEILLVGAEAARALGTTPDALIGVVWQDAPWWTFDADVHRRIRNAFERAAAGERVAFTSAARIGERRRMFELTLTPQRDGQGAVRAIVAEGRDVTEGQRSHEDLAAEKQRQALANADLMAFNYTVSHDLKAPIRGIQAYSRALMEDHHDELSADAKSLMARLTGECDRMSRTITDLLTLARATQGDIRRTRVDVSAIARDVADELRQREPGRAIEFTITPNIEATADAGLVRVLLQNLIGNAWKFTKQERPACIKVGTEETDSGRCIFVKDNGAGFDAADSPELFEPFKRFHSAESFEGTGIGLATVRRIVTAHGGRIWARSRPSEGATFRFTLAPDASRTVRPPT